jgi:hypothetical protein
MAKVSKFQVFRVSRSPGRVRPFELGTQLLREGGGGEKRPDFCMMEITQKGDHDHRNGRSIGLK